MKVPFKLTEFNEDMVYQINRNFEELLREMKKVEREQEDITVPIMANLESMDVRNYLHNSRADMEGLHWKFYGNSGTAGAPELRQGHSGDFFFTLNPGLGALAYIEQDLDDVDHRDSYYLSFYYASGTLEKGPGAYLKATLTLEYINGEQDSFDLEAVL